LFRVQQLGLLPVIVIEFGTAVYRIAQFFSHPKVPRRRGSPLDTPLAPPIRSAIIDILMVTRMAMVWTVNSTLSWGVYIIA